MTCSNTIRGNARDAAWWPLVQLSRTPSLSHSSWPGDLPCSGYSRSPMISLIARTLMRWTQARGDLRPVFSVGGSRVQIIVCNLSGNLSIPWLLLRFFANVAKNLIIRPTSVGGWQRWVDTYAHILSLLITNHGALRCACVCPSESLNTERWGIMQLVPTQTHSRRFLGWKTKNIGLLGLI